MYQKSTIYSPQCSFCSQAYGMGGDKPMTNTLNHTILGLVPRLDHKIVCKECRGRRLEMVS